MKRMTKMEKVERIHELTSGIDDMEGTYKEILERKYTKPFRIEVNVSGSNRSWGIQPRDFSEETQLRLQKYYKRLIGDELRSMKAERTKLLRNLK